MKNTICFKGIIVKESSTVNTYLKGYYDGYITEDEAIEMIELEIKDEVQCSSELDNTMANESESIQ